MMMKDIVVIGLGIFGNEIARQLEIKGNTVLAIDQNPNEIDRIKDFVSEAVVADLTDETALKELEIVKFDLVILGLGSNFENLVLGVTHLRHLGVTNIIARATSEIQQEILFKIGAKEVILPEKQSAMHLAERISVPSIKEYIELDEKVHLAEIRIDDKMAGKSLQDLNLRKKYNISALLLKKAGQEVQVLIDPEEVLQKNDELIVVGNKQDLEHFFK